jgi:hypothetical protein
VTPSCSLRLAFGLGPQALLDYGVLAALFGGVKGVPYGIALAAAGLMVYPQTSFMAALGPSSAVHLNLCLTASRNRSAGAAEIFCVQAEAANLARTLTWR